MKKLLIGLILLLTWAPYTFLATKVEDVEGSRAEYSCIVGETQKVESLIGFGSVYYNNGRMSADRRIILPYFNVKGEEIVVDCKSRIFSIGKSDWVKKGDKIRVNTEIRKVTLFGKELLREEGIYMFGTD